MLVNGEKYYITQLGHNQEGQQSVEISTFGYQVCEDAHGQKRAHLPIEQVSTIVVSEEFVVVFPLVALHNLKQHGRCLLNQTNDKDRHEFLHLEDPLVRVCMAAFNLLALHEQVDRLVLSSSRYPVRYRVVILKFCKLGLYLQLLQYLPISFSFLAQVNHNGHFKRMKDEVKVVKKRHK